MEVTGNASTPKSEGAGAPRPTETRAMSWWEHRSGSSDELLCRSGAWTVMKVRAPGHGLWEEPRVHGFYFPDSPAVCDEEPRKIPCVGGRRRRKEIILQHAHRDLHNRGIRSGEKDFLVPLGGRRLWTPAPTSPQLKEGNSQDSHEGNSPGSEARYMQKVNEKVNK